MQFIIGCYNINVIILIVFRMDVVFIVFVLQCCVVVVSGYFGGVFFFFCVGMVLGYGVVVQVGVLLYMVIMNVLIYIVGDVIEGMVCVYCFEL